MRVMWFAPIRAGDSGITGGANIDEFSVGRSNFRVFTSNRNVNMNMKRISLLLQPAAAQRGSELVDLITLTL